MADLKPSLPDWGKLDSDGQRGFESLCKQNLRRSPAMISDLARPLAELRNRGVTVLPYSQGMLASVRRAEQKILDVNGQGGRQLRKSPRASYNKYR